MKDNTSALSTVCRRRPSLDAGQWFYRHALAVRLCHWINVVAFGMLLVSGLNILLDFPALYWGRVGFMGYPAWLESEDLGIAREWAWEFGAFTTLKDY